MLHPTNTYIQLIEVSLDSVHAPQFSLSHISLLACFASDAVYYIRTHIFTSIITLAHKSASYTACMVQYRTIFAICGFAFIASFAVKLTIPFGSYT